jgi:hypothetical protein
MEIIDLDSKKINEISPVAPKESQIPINYIPIELSTNGMLNVPKVIHIRNFITEDLLNLSMYSQSVLPEKVVSVLNSMIYEKIDVSDWPDRVIIELLVKLYANFFTPMLSSIDFPWDDTDIKFLRDNNRNDEADDILNGIFKPKITLDLTTINTDILDSDLKSKVTINKKLPNGIQFKAKFRSYPKYGDVLKIKNLIEKKFRDSDKKYQKIKQDYELKETLIREGINLQNLPIIDEYEFNEWQIYEASKAIYALKGSQALYLIDLNGKDVSNMDLDTKINLLTNEVNYDITMAQKIESEYNKLKYGLNPEVKVLNPITQQECVRSFYFQELDIFYAIQSNRTYEYDITYDD